MSHTVDHCLATPEGHYVYIYYDDGKSDRAKYVGYGHSADRASRHLSGSHNPALEQFLADRQYRISIAGPFQSEEMGRAVETALISALKPVFNANLGPTAWRFRPLGVPSQYADRQVAPELGLADILTAQGSMPTPVLFVIVNTKDLAYDGRLGYDPATPPSDDVIRVRVDRWWQLGKHLGGWESSPEMSPGLLVGVFGSPGRQTVIASLRIHRAGWSGSERRDDNKGRVRVPLVEPADLDAFALRGRRIAPAAGLKFGNFSTESFAVLDTGGSLSFGRRARK